METRQEAKAKLKQFGIDACVYTLILVIAFTLIETTNSFFQIKSNSFFAIAGLALGLIYWKRVLLKRIIHGFNTKSDEELEAAGKEFRKSVLKKAGGFLVVVILFAWVLNTYIMPGAIYDIVGYQVCERAVDEAVKGYAGKISAIQNVVKSERPALKPPANAQRVVASCMGDATINGSTMKVAIYKWFVKSGNDSGFEYHIEPVALDALTNLLGTLGNQENSKDGSAAEKEAEAAPAQPDAQPSAGSATTKFAVITVKSVRENEIYTIDVIADVPDLNKTDVTLSVSPEGNQKSVAITTYIKNHIGEKVAIQYTGSGTKEDPYIIDDLSNAANPTIESK